MRHIPGIRVLGTACLLIGCLILTGCPKKSEVGQSTAAPPGAYGMSVTPRLPEASQSPAGQQGVVSPEVQITPRPGVGVEAVPGTQAGQAGQGTAAPAQAASPLQDVFYDYDTATIRGDQKAAIDADVAWLRAHAGTKITIEGHCDERGSDEYNLGLGERRARAAKDALVAAGVAADRIATISYGKERPFVIGHDENEWKWNRRAHFELQAEASRP